MSNATQESTPDNTAEALSDQVWLELQRVSTIDILDLARTIQRDPDEAMRIAAASARSSDTQEKVTAA